MKSLMPFKRSKIVYVNYSQRTKEGEEPPIAEGDEALPIDGHEPPPPAAVPPAGRRLRSEKNREDELPWSPASSPQSTIGNMRLRIRFMS
ncbi:hypothetical protein E3N88_15300 [Mikania micrantha]|uniref:Uncharacterized protein n=1 Tax=Mikania micrantha TaxID=192012 RepID=A0A5N6NV02_9ASTR|nr:hypothetical protein E3N88_15300 [Mikania micrantha]